MHKRLFVQALASLAGTSLLAPSLMAQARPQVEVWKDPNCGCCKDWVVHMEANGFDVKVHDSGNSAARKRLGVPDKLGSCHTALVGGYAIEGHVPAREVHRLLKERPAAVGLSVPGMPVGSPGMDGPEYGTRKDPYDVVLFSRSGATRVYQSYHRA
ncbi:MAG: metal-binding protein [Polaromonas sp.]|nr:metal-binding protein [Polaromonas sp.]